LAEPDRRDRDDPVSAPPADLLADLAAGFDEAAGRFDVSEYAIAVGGHGIRMRFTGDRSFGNLTAAFDHLAKPAATDPTDTINCWADQAEFGLPPSLLALDPSGNDTSPARWTLRERYPFITGFEGCIDVFDPSGPLAWRRIFTERLPWWEIAAPLRNPLFWLLGGCGRFLTHAAAVAVDGQAALVVGPGGSGKSTTALTCLLDGMDYLGDDYTVTSLDEEPLVHSLYGSAKLQPEGVEGMEALIRDAGEFTGTDGEKLVVWPIRTLPDRVVTDARIRAILVPTITGATGTTLASIAPAAALRALAPSSILQFPAGGATSLSAMARLVEAVPCFALQLGSDRRLIPGVVASAIG
jgi:hypothetical protein